MTGSSPSLRSRGHAQRRSHWSTALGPPGRILGHPERFARGAVRQVGHASAAWRPGPVWLHKKQGTLWRASTPPTAPGMAVWNARRNDRIRSNRFPTATPDGAARSAVRFCDSYRRSIASPMRGKRPSDQREARLVAKMGTFLQDA